jgi:SAM-dependent methyltransferase
VELPFESESFDVVMSSIGVMFAPHHRAAADELVRVCRPGGTIGLLSWPPEGMLGALFRTMKPFAPPPPPGAQSPPLWGSEEHLADLFGERAMFGMLRRDVLEITAFARARDYGEHFKAYYGPTIAARTNAARDGREREFAPRSTRSATSGTAAPTTARGSRRSICWPSARASADERAWRPAGGGQVLAGA